MGLANELAKAEVAPTSTPYQRCGVWLLWDALEGNDREALVKLLDHQEWMGTKIIEVFRRAAEEEDDPRARSLYGSISSATVQRHRRGACTCGGLS